MKIEQLQGQNVLLKPAQLRDRRLIYEWMALSDITKYMLGPPHFPEQLPPTWEKFCDDYAEYYFSDDEPMLGRSYLILSEQVKVGHINYNQIESENGVNSTELDIWLRSEKDCGRGIGSDAIQTLCNFLNGTHHVTEFWMQPSARNPRAISVYETVGFVKQLLSQEEIDKKWTEPDYFDSVFMVKRMALVE